MHLDSLPAMIAHASSNPQTTLSFLYSSCLWFFSWNTSISTCSYNWGSISVGFSRFPLLLLPVVQWFQVLIFHCILLHDPKEKHCYGSWVCSTTFYPNFIQHAHWLNTIAVSNATTWWAVTPLNLAALCYPDTLKQSSGLAKTRCQERKDHYLQ